MSRKQQRIIFIYQPGTGPAILAWTNSVGYCIRDAIVDGSGELRLQADERLDWKLPYDPSMEEFGNLMSDFMCRPLLRGSGNNWDPEEVRSALIQQFIDRFDPLRQQQM